MSSSPSTEEHVLRRSVWPWLGLWLLAVVLFVLSFMLGIADTGDSPNYYMWAALAGSVACAVVGTIGLIRRRTSRA